MPLSGEMKRRTCTQMSSSLPWVSDSCGTGKWREGKKGRRYGGVSDAGRKLTAGLYMLSSGFTLASLLVFDLSSLTSRSWEPVKNTNDCSLNGNNGLSSLKEIKTGGENRSARANFYCLFCVISKWDHLHSMSLVKGNGDMIYARELRRHSSFQANELLFSTETMEVLLDSSLNLWEQKKGGKKLNWNWRPV